MQRKDMVEVKEVCQDLGRGERGGYGERKKKNRKILGIIDFKKPKFKHSKGLGLMPIACIDIQWTLKYLIPIMSL